MPLSLIKVLIFVMHALIDRKGIMLIENFNIQSKELNDFLKSRTNFSCIEGVEVELSRISSLDKDVKRALSKSMLIRHLDVGSSNAEEAELLALSCPTYDLTRFGLDFTASPRHADILTVSGPVTRHLKIAMEKTYNAMPSPKIVIALGDGACNGSIYDKTYACLGKVADFLPVDICIPGDPPTPIQILQGLLLCKYLLGLS